MLRFLGFRGAGKTIFSTSRLPLTLEHQAQQNLLRREDVQRVRFKRPGVWHYTKRFGIYTVMGFVAINILSKTLPQLEITEEERAAMEDEELEGFYFIPFPGTTQEIKPKPYKATDPEWKEFVTFSQSAELKESTKVSLVELVRKTAEGNKALVRTCGQGFKVRRSWLDVDFPSHPNPEFIRSGIAIHDDGNIEWLQVPVDSLVVFKIRKALWPTALAESFWSMIKVACENDVKRAGTYLGFDMGALPPTMEQLIEAHNKKVARLRGKVPAKADHQLKENPAQPPSMDDAPAKKIMIPRMPGAKPSDDSEKPSNPSPAKASPTGKVPSSIPVPDPTVSPKRQQIDKIGTKLITHFFGGILAFKQKMAEKWKAPVAYAPRGSIIVSGLVELDAPKAWVVMDVFAGWDPKTKAFDPYSMLIRVRRLQPKKQQAMG